MSYRLLGPHVNRDKLLGNTTQLISAWQPPVIVGIASQPGDWWQIRHAAPRSLIVMRAFPDDSLNPHYGEPFDIKATARLLTARAIRATTGYPLDWLQVTNEPWCKGPDAVKRAAEFDSECARYAAGYGIRTTFANFGTGYPEPEDWQHYDCSTLVETGGVLLLHEYNWAHMDTPDAIWYSLRHRLFMPPLLKRWASVQLIIGETGHDAGVRGQGVRQGWQNHVTPEAYLSELRAHSLELENDPYILGAAIFALAPWDPDWHSYDIAPILPDLARDAWPLYRRVSDAQPAEALGVDVSQFQGRTVWYDLQRAGKRFGISRASVRMSVDPQWERNARRAPQYMEAHGAYHFPYTSHTADDQARLFGTLCMRAGLEPWPREFGGDGVTPLCALDVERDASYPSQKPDAAFTRRFCQEFQDVTGWQPWIYTSRWFWDNVCRIGNVPWAGAHRLWVADHGKRDAPLLPSAWDDWNVWQYGVGRVAGVRMDLNRSR